MRWILARLFGLALFPIGATSSALAYSCPGIVDAVNVGPDGVVWMDSAASGIRWVELCQLGGGTVNGVTADACRAITAVLLSAQASGQPVNMSFNDSLSCTTHPQNTWLTGWYYGPQIYTP